LGALQRARRASHRDVASHNMHLAGRYQLRGFPSVILFIQEEEAGRFSGARSEQQVRTFISGLVPAFASRDTGA
jgi:thioredoxin-like negative regulator of GroEL